VGGWGLGCGVVVLWFAPHPQTPKPPIPNPQSPIPNFLIIINKYSFNQNLNK